MPPRRFDPVTDRTCPAAAYNPAMSSIRRHFLGWDRPLVRTAVPWIDQFLTTTQTTAGDRAGRVIIVTPTLRGASLIRRRIAEPATLKVEVLTVGDLPTRLIRRDESTVPADDLRRSIAWAYSLAALPETAVRTLVATPPPPAGDAFPAGWLPLAGVVVRMHNDLAARGLTFADVAAAAREEFDANDSTSGDVFRRRWDVLTDCLARYAGRLAAEGRHDPLLSRQSALERHELRLDGRLILVGTSDLPLQTSRLIRAAAATATTPNQSPVQSLVAAPADAADRFDDLGVCRPDAWADATVGLRDVQLAAADDTADAADLAVRWAAAGTETRTTAGVTLGHTDDSFIEPLVLAGELHGVDTHRESGRVIAATAPGRIVRRVGDFLARRNFETLAALVRHADAVAVIASRVDVPAETLIARLDAYRSACLPVGIDDPPPSRGVEEFTDVRSMIDDVVAWTAPLAAAEGGLSHRAAAWRTWLADIYESPLRNRPRSIAAFERIRQWLDTVAGPDTNIDADAQPTDIADPNAENPNADNPNADNPDADNPDAGDATLTPREFVDVFIDATSAMRVADPRLPDQVPIVGWLDLAMDDSPVTAVVGFNHPYLPEAFAGEPMVPPELRSRLRTDDNARRYARDAHTLQCLAASREQLRLIAGRRAADSSPTPPSRLIAAADADDVARRIRLLQRDSSHPPDRRDRWDDAARDGSAMVLPPTIVTRPVTSAAVTAFGEYLACPYRFYVRRKLKARPSDDTAAEMDAAQFGNLVHDTLEIFGRDESTRRLSDVAAIDEALGEALRGIVRRDYGRRPAATVRLQIDLARRRLSNVARVQAERAAEGWTIHAAERAIEPPQSHVVVDGEPFGVRGRLDRIDHHPATGRWAILDYKTHRHSPKKKHLDGDQWIDLQLPLYRRLLPTLGIDAKPDDLAVGYFNIGETAAETQIQWADFDDDQWSAADAAINDVVRGMRSGRFDPSPTPPRYDDYAMLFP